MTHEPGDTKNVLGRPARAIQEQLKSGTAGIVMGRAGVGKTACLVQIGLEYIAREQPVLHVSLSHGVEHVESWYDALLEDSWRRGTQDTTVDVSAHVGRLRTILAFVNRTLTAEKLTQSLNQLVEGTGFKPAVILIAGFDWERNDAEAVRRDIDGFKKCAAAVDAALWMTARTHRESTGEEPAAVPEPCAPYADLAEAVCFLQPKGSEVALKWLKAPGSDGSKSIALGLDPHTLRVVVTGEYATIPVRLPNSAYTLLSGGAPGSESAFGECAERWGLIEQNFTFTGRQTARERGLVTLDEQELSEGAVSKTYIEAHMNRKYAPEQNLDRVLKSIWHQVNTAGEVFAVGQILDDKTVKGGTGWAVELGRHLRKPVHVFDQEQGRWYTWQGNDWKAAGDLVIQQRRFCGTGTKSINEVGCKAIEALFTRSFGPVENSPTE